MTAVMELADKLLDDLNDRSGFSLDEDVRCILRDDWIVLIAKHLIERGGAGERELRRELDAMTHGLAAAIALFDNNWCTAHGHDPRPEAFVRADELRKLGGLPDGNYPPPPPPRSPPR